MQRIDRNQGQTEKHGKVERNTAKQAPKNDTGKQSTLDEPGEGSKASNKRRKKQSNSMS
jgi:hypothetical protein